MTFNQRATQFMGREIVDYVPARGIQDPKAAQRIALGWDDEPVPPIVELLDPFLADPVVGQVEALVMGIWSLESSESSSGLVERLVSGAGQLRSLTGLFLGDISYEEQECSWILQSNLTPLFGAFPHLRVLRARGSSGLVIEPTRHSSLEELAIECGGLPEEIVASLHESNLPSLRHLELWIGDEDYGRTVAADDLRPLLTGERLPALEHLVFCNSDIAGETVAMLCDVGVPASLTVLDLSKGTLSDEEARPLLASRDRFAELERLDLSENFLSQAMVDELGAAGIPIVATDQREADEDGDDTYRYVVVGE